MSADKYPSLFSRQMEAIVYIATFSSRKDPHPSRIRVQGDPEREESGAALPLMLRINLSFFGSDYTVHFRPR